MTIRKLILTGLLGLAVAGPAVAQNPTTNTQNPPAPNAGSQMPEPTNSLPSGAGGVATERPGSNVGTAAPSAADVTAPSNGSGSTESVPRPAIR